MNKIMQWWKKSEYKWYRPEYKRISNISYSRWAWITLVFVLSFISSTLFAQGNIAATLLLLFFGTTCVNFTILFGIRWIDENERIRSKSKK
jgi:archaellum biogenesis protein FlaJ (TadC family)